jgi:hypothetical protein
MANTVSIQEVTETDDLLVSGCCCDALGTDDGGLTYGHCHAEVGGNRATEWEEVLVGLAR